MRIQGIHHVTAIAGSPRTNVDFYTRVLGLRLVKRTVNFDDPGTWHLYYGDQEGRPGSILTFFPYEGAVAGREGMGMAGETSLSIDAGSLDTLLERFADLEVSGRYPAFSSGPAEVRFGERVIPFRDPDGLPLALVAKVEAQPMGTFDGVTLLLKNIEPTQRLLTDVFGYEEAGEDSGRQRLEAPGQAGRIDLIQHDKRPRRGAGTVHHVAFRARDDDEQAEWRERLASFGLSVTDVKDRQYFHSIYFREPGGVLFEIATDPPGFALDEDIDSLGEKLKLPPWLEPRRSVIEQRLPDLGVSKPA